MRREAGMDRDITVNGFVRELAIQVVCETKGA